MKTVKCDDCKNIVVGNEIYYGPDGDFCAWCHTKRYGDDEKGKYTFQESVKVKP
jgi:hypothetical protein